MNLKVTRGARYEYEDLDSGRLYFSVSQVLEVLDPNAFSDVSYEILEGAQFRGRRVHHLFAKALAWKACLHDRPTCEAPLQGYLQSIIALVEKEHIRPILIEHKDIDPQWPIAGTFDGKLLWGPKDIVTLADLKTGKERRRAHRVQLQLYKRFAVNRDVKEMKTIYAQADGSLAIVEVVKRDPADEAWALNAIAVLVGRTY